MLHFRRCKTWPKIEFAFIRFLCAFSALKRQIASKWASVAKWLSDASFLPFEYLLVCLPIYLWIAFLPKRREENRIAYLSPLVLPKWLLYWYGHLDSFPHAMWKVCHSGDQNITLWRAILSFQTTWSWKVRHSVHSCTFAYILYSVHTVCYTYNPFRIFHSFTLFVSLKANNSPSCYKVMDVTELPLFYNLPLSLISCTLHTSTYYCGGGVKYILFVWPYSTCG